MLILAGGGAYYFAKRSINADREERALAMERRRQATRPVRASDVVASSSKNGVSDRPSPSLEAGADPAPVGHVGEENGVSKGKFEAAEPFRSRKGDRFS